MPTRLVIRLTLLVLAGLFATEGCARAAAPRKILFICTGNYYRSRFAEAVFNHKAHQRGLSWTAFSRGIKAHRTPPDNLSPFAANELQRLGIRLQQPVATPTRLSEQDLRQADLIIALDRAEHESMLRKAFPRLDLSRVVFWDVKDVPIMAPGRALPLIVKDVDELMGRLAR